MAKKYKNQELRQKVSISLGAIILFILIALGVMEYFNRQAQKYVNTLYDTTVIDFEAYRGALNNLVTIYSIYDDNSYQNAKKSCNLSDTLYHRIFTTEKYSGSYVKKPTVAARTIEYELEPSLDNVRTYYVVLEVRNNDNNKTRVYNIIATLKDEMLIDYYAI